ncbi:hypothetical protein DNTS_025741, partial [Danionella cerebrum]
MRTKMAHGLQVDQTQLDTTATQDRSSLEAHNLEEHESSTPSEPKPDSSVPPDGSRSPVAPDGGWGWVVVAATILVLAMTLAFPSCIGIFYNDLQKDFQASNTETSWVPAIMMGVLHAC